MEVLGSHVILLASIIFPLTVAVTYTLAVTSDHVYPLMPFMSYTGDLPLESCIFSLGLNISAVLYVVICVLRYNQVLQFYDENVESSVKSLNIAALRWGIASSIGLSITGSFQEINAPIVHPLGALTCSYCGFVFLWHQTIISRILMGQLNSVCVAYLRIAISITSTVLHFMAPFLVAFLDTLYPRQHHETLRWSEKEAGWRLHVSCSTMEWIVFFLNVVYIASYYKEFQNIQIHSDEIVFYRRRQT